MFKCLKLLLKGQRLEKEVESLKAEIYILKRREVDSSSLIQYLGELINSHREKASQSLSMHEQAIATLSKCQEMNTKAVEVIVGLVQRVRVEQAANQGYLNKLIDESYDDTEVSMALKWLEDIRRKEHH